MSKAPDRIWAWGHSGDTTPIRGFATVPGRGTEYVRADIFDAVMVALDRYRGQLDNEGQHSAVDAIDALRNR